MDFQLFKEISDKVLDDMQRDIIKAKNKKELKDFQIFKRDVQDVLSKVTQEGEQGKGEDNDNCLKGKEVVLELDSALMYFAENEAKRQGKDLSFWLTELIAKELFLK